MACETATDMERSLRLLLVEDNPGDEELVREWLDHGEFCRFDVSTVSTLEAARESLSESMFDAIILDLTLPDSQGVETVAQLRAACDTVPILVLTGSSSDDIRLQAFQAGAQDFYGKNESPGNVLARGILYTVERFCVNMQQHYLEGLVASSPDAVLVVDLCGIVQFVNQAALDLFGKSRDDLLGDLFPFSVDDGLMVEIAVARNGERRVAEMRVTGIEWVGQPAYLATLRDRTEYKQIEDQLRQSQKMEAIGRLAGGVAHDFNNLMTVVNGYVEVLLQDESVSAGQRDMLEHIGEAGQRASALTRQLLAFSRKSVLIVEPLPLNDVISKAAKLLRRLIGEDIELELALDPAAGEVLADRTQLEQVIVNLAVNARDAMATGGRIRIETSRVTVETPLKAPPDHAPQLEVGEYARMSVSDTGTGMTPEVRSKIFEPFFTTKEQSKGTGLGLSTVYGIVSQLSGRVTCYSELGKGTEICIYLPPSHQAPAAARKTTSAEPVDSRGTETVLLVEDDDNVRELCRRILTSYGYEVLGAGDGATAITLARDHEGPVHLLLTDVVMPDMTGPELAKRIAELYPGTRMLLISGYSDDAIDRRGVTTGDLEFLQKPFTRASLAGKVREVLDNPPPE